MPLAAAFSLSESFPEAMLDEAGISVTDRRSFMGVDALFVRDPDRTVIEIIGPGPDVADLVAQHSAKDDLEAKH